MTSEATRVLAVLALVAGILMAPLGARVEVGGRGLGAEVVGDDAAYTALVTHAPTLNASNAYEDDAMTVTNNNAAGTSLEVTVTSDDGRFVISGGTFTLAPGASDTAQLLDSSTDHATGTYSVDLTVTVEVRSDGSTIGDQVVTRTVTVEVT